MMYVCRYLAIAAYCLTGLPNKFSFIDKLSLVSILMLALLSRK